MPRKIKATEPLSAIADLYGNREGKVPPVPVPLQFSDVTFRKDGITQYQPTRFKVGKRKMGDEAVYFHLVKSMGAADFSHRFIYTNWEKGRSRDRPIATEDIEFDDNLRPSHREYEEGIQRGFGENKVKCKAAWADFPIWAALEAVPGDAKKSLATNKDKKDAANRSRSGSNVQGSSTSERDPHQGVGDTTEAQQAGTLAVSSTGYVQSNSPARIALGEKDLTDSSHLTGSRGVTGQVQDRNRGSIDTLRELFTDRMGYVSRKRARDIVVQVDKELARKKSVGEASHRVTRQDQNRQRDDCRVIEELITGEFGDYYREQARELRERVESKSAHRRAVDEAFRDREGGRDVALE